MGEGKVIIMTLYYPVSNSWGKMAAEPEAKKSRVEMR